MVHTAFTARDGAPENINSLAQTADGTLWLGTRDGLYSFDGLTFSVFQPKSGSVPRRNVQSLFATRDGDLWAFGSAVRAIRIRDGVATRFDRVANASFISLGYIQQSSDHAIWAILNQKNLVRLGPDGKWHVLAGARPDSQQIGAFFIDSSDTQWLVADNLLYRRSREQDTFSSTAIPVYGFAKFEEAQDHTIWIAGYSPIGIKRKQPAGQPPEVGLKHVDRLGRRLPNPFTKFDVTDIAVGLDGSLWVSHVDSGLQRLRAAEMNGRLSKDEDPPDSFGIGDGLTTTGYRAFLRDRDGNIWVAGGRGLDRFQHATLVAAVPNAINGLWSVCVAPNGDIRLSLFDGFFAVIQKGRLRRLKDQPSAGALLCSSDGSVWLRGGGGIAEARKDGVQLLPVLPGLGSYGDRYHFTSMILLPDHRLLASTTGAVENGLWTYEHKRWKRFLPSSGIARIRALWEDQHNNLYLGSDDGMVIVLQPGSFVVASSESVGIGAVEGFSKTRYGLFAFGENGFALQQNGRFHMLSLANPELAMSITGLVEDRKGDIWINGVHAIARISCAEISAAASDRSHRMLAREFREGEFRGSDHNATPRNSAQIDPQGKIWLSTANGVIYIDPQQVARPSHIPAPTIRSISADGRPLKANRRFPPRTQTLNAHYSAIDISDPADVIYRYKLIGSDANWQDVGSRREAVYTHLAPGTYTFQVMASNDGERWSAPAESAPFTILPAFYQTWWFQGLAAACAILLLWATYTARVRYVARAVRMRAEERANERVRIARELHDTLLQGVQGLLLSFHVAVEKVPDSHESKQALEKALGTADRIIIEGRDRVNRLRSDRLANSDFERSIEELADDLSRILNVEFAMESIGTREPLKPDILEEIFYIAREALTNASRHSGASRIVLALHYGKRQFSMECRDNGKGFSALDVRDAEAKGHWGLRGMAERAERVGAKFSHESVPGNGTRILVALQADRAYVGARPFWTLFHFRKAGL